MRAILKAFSLLGVLLGAVVGVYADDADLEQSLPSLFPLGVRGLPGAYEGAAGGKERRAAIEMGLEWLAAHQAKDGSWPPHDLTWCHGEQKKPGPPDPGKALYVPGVTGMVVSAFLGAGYTHQDKHPYGSVIQRGLAWLQKAQNKEGRVGPLTTQQWIYNHAFGALALVEAYACTGDSALRGSAQRAIAFSEQARNPGWAWRYGVKPGDNDTSVVGCMTMPLYLAWRMNQAAARIDLIEPLSLDVSAFAGVRAWIDKVTDPDYGRVGYLTSGTGPARPQDLVEEFPGERSESMTAIGVLLRKALPGWEPAEKNDELVAMGVKLMLDLAPDWSPGAGRIDLYYWYYATMAMRLVGGVAWMQWDQKLVHALLAAQQTDGDVGRMRGSWDPLGPWGMDGGRMYSTALALLMLETPDRLQPLPADRSDLLPALRAEGLESAQRARIVRALGLYAVAESGGEIVPFVGGDDDELRAAAADALERLDAGRNGTRALGKFLGDVRVSVRRAAVRSLVHQGAHLGPLVPALQERLKDDDTHVAVQAARALGAAGNPDAATALRSRLDAPVVRLRVATAAALWRLTQDGTSVLPALKDGLGSKHASARIEAALTLHAMGAGAAPAQAELVQALKDDSLRVRVHAASALWALGTEKKKVVRAWTSALSASAGATRLLAMEGLEAAGAASARATDALAAQLLSGPRHLRRAAARTLAAIGPGAAKAAAALHYCAEYGKPGLREDARKACDALALTPHGALECLLPALEAKDSRLVGGATLGLAARGSEVVPRLVGELDTGKAARCGQLLVVLERIGPDAAAGVPAVAEILASGPTVQLRCYAAGVLGAIGPAAASALDILSAALRDPSPHVRLYVVGALGGVGQGSEKAVRMLADLLGSPRREDRTLKPKAAEALGALGAKAKPALPALFKLLGGKDGRARSAAIRALGALVPHSLDGLRRILREDHTNARPGAAQAVALAGPAAKKAVPDLAAVLREGRIVNVRDNTYGAALAAIGKPSVRALIKLLGHKEEGVKAVAATTLGRIGADARSALGALRRHARNSSSIVANAAKKAIEQIRAAK